MLDRFVTAGFAGDVQIIENAYVDAVAGPT